MLWDSGRAQGGEKNELPAANVRSPFVVRTEKGNSKYLEGENQKNPVDFFLSSNVSLFWTCGSKEPEPHF